MALSLIAFDTAHIKSYVFATNRLTEIRGGSSLLDGLNRLEMRKIAADLPINDRSIKVAPVYTNGGSGLFVLEADEKTTVSFGRQVQRAYREQSGGRAFIDFAVQELRDNPEEKQMQPLTDEDRKALDSFFDEAQEYKNLPVSEAIQTAMQRNLHPQLEQLRYKLREKKDSPPDIITLSSHPFMRPCDSCGTEYAEEPQDRNGQTEFYCASCRAKQEEDHEIKKLITKTVKATINHPNTNRYEKASLWGRILTHLKEVKYEFPKDASKLDDLDRPDDFNEFRHFTKSKDYLGLIYADANNMGTVMEKLPRLLDIYTVANDVDKHIHLAMRQAIKKHLPIVEVEKVVEVKVATEKIVEVKKEKKIVPLFPFDILLLGGDDIVMVTDAAKAMDVAVTIAQEFRELTEKKYTLSISVVLAPVKYPFGLVWAIAQSALKFAKKEGSKTRKSDEDNTRINFLTVTGGSVNDFKEVFDETYHKKDKVKHLTDTNEFYATLRPYTVKGLVALLNDIREAKKLRLGRTKLHQLREAVLDKNLTTSVTKGLALLSNWRGEERTFVARRVYEFGGHNLSPNNSRDSIPSFPHVTFPWFFAGPNDDKQNIYRTPLLDLIELYDFVIAREEASGNGE